MANEPTENKATFQESGLKQHQQSLLSFPMTLPFPRTFFFPLYQAPKRQHKLNVDEREEQDKINGTKLL